MIHGLLNGCGDCSLARLQDLSRLILREGEEMEATAQTEFRSIISHPAVFHRARSCDHLIFISSIRMPTTISKFSVRGNLMIFSFYEDTCSASSPMVLVHLYLTRHVMSPILHLSPCFPSPLISFSFIACRSPEANRRWRLVFFHDLFGRCSIA
jgi:hypothetical protein